MDILTGQRTFYLAVSGTGTNVSQITNIPFFDTSGKAMTCNYVKLVGAIGDTTGNGSFVGELSGLSRTGDMVTNTLSAVTASPIASGICGVGAIFGAGTQGVAEWHGSNGELCTGVKLQVMSTAPHRWLIGVTYGNLLPYNPIRGMNITNGDGSYDRGI